MSAAAERQNAAGETSQDVCPVRPDHVAAIVLHDPPGKLINDLAATII